MNDFTNWSELPITLKAQHIEKNLGISRPIVYNLFYQSNFPSIKVSENRWIVPKDQFKLWLEKQSLNKIKESM